MDDRELKYSEQQVDVYAHLVKLRNSKGERYLIDNPDLWFASKVNATLKSTSASEVYFEKKELPQEAQNKFIEGVRNHSWNRQHMGAMVVGSADFEASVSSLVSSAFALGKFYKMQQQTRRSVILTDVTEIPELSNNKDVIASYEARFRFYWDIVDKRPDKVKGFDPIVQDIFKILPLSTKTRMAGTLDLRTLKGYARWQNFDYLPTSVRDFASKLDKSTTEEYPIMFKSFDLSIENKANEEMYAKQLQMIESIGSKDLMDEPLLWYSDHSFLLHENKYFDSLYNNFRLEEVFKDPQPDAILLGYFNPLGLDLQDLLDLFENKDEATKTAIELATFSFISKIDLSGGIDTWRHTRSNRMVQPIYHALENNAKVAMPALYLRQEKSGSEVPDEIIDLSEDAISLYHQLVKDGVNMQEAINVLPHNLELIQVEMMDIFSFLNIMAIRTCIHARPDVQIWAKAMLRSNLFLI